MSRPPLPARVTSLVRAITADTWNQLLACVEYAMQNPRGDGKTIRNHGEILQAVSSPRGGGAALQEEKYQGYWDLEVTPATTPYTFTVKVFSSYILDGDYAGYIQSRDGQSSFTVPTFTTPTPLAAKYRYLFYLDVTFDSSDKQKISAVTPRIWVRRTGGSSYLAQSAVFPVLYFEISESGKAKVLWRAGYDMPLFVDNPKC